MPNLLSESILRMVRSFESRPHTDLAHVIARGLREYDRLAHKTVLGEPHAPPIIWELFIALGNHVNGPAYCFYPPPEDREVLVAIDRINAALSGRRHAPCRTEEIQALAASGLMTAAIALYGKDGTGKPILALGYHPQLRFGQAVTMIMASLHQENQALRHRPS